ncbi:thioredoxin family protein [Bowmanella denitrificans]|uniref:Thioredoxin family protein n=1 Tax=Bowmanella denitrificans TaxID=366582 RepID=A0ABN0XNP8_9ALTE
MNKLGISLLACLWLALQSGAAVADSSATGPHIRVQLLSEQSGLQAGRENWLGVLFSPDPHWHTYWQNPGDSGEPPSLQWTLPDGVSAGHIQWPLPGKIPVAHLVNYGYEGANLLMVPISVAEDLVGLQLDLQVSVSWLVCREDCIPGWADLSLSLPVTDHPEPGPQAELFQQTRARLPVELQLSGLHEVTEQHISLAFTPPVSGNWQVLPLQAGVIQHNQPQQRVETATGLTLLLAKSDYFETHAETALDFLVTNGEQGWYLRSELNSGLNAAQTPLWLYGLMALLGGIILNVMPCVLPVLSLKAMSLRTQGTTGAAKWAYPLGVILSFLAFALLIEILKQSGQMVGWGFHMQEPVVIAFLAYLFVFIALMLMDVAPSGARLAGMGQSLTQGHSFVSQFFTGVLAVLVASPCTAPFMAAALGVALVSGLSASLWIFFCLGVGFALPLTLLFIFPTLTRVLPTPGAWMQTFRQFLVFPMLATVVWLVWVFAGLSGNAAQAMLLAGLLLFALFIWLGRSQSTLLSTGALVMALVLMVWQLWLVAVSDTASADVRSAFSRQTLDQLRSENKVVLVNMTADWCITCKVNEQVALTDEALLTLFEQPNVHYLVGDWTNKNAEILTFLQQYQRSGVPLYVVYAGQRSEQVLPQILTTQLVIDAIQNAREELQP